MLTSPSVQEEKYKYEGAEKLLEAWFFDVSGNSSKSTGNADLRSLSRVQIVHLLNLAKCEIVDECHSYSQLGFILSESSLFITQNRLILKTCGQTRLMNALGPLIGYAFELGFTTYVLYYSRRSYLYPELQEEPYNDFRKEIKMLNSFCDNGSGYTFGPLNGDCWNFYYGKSVTDLIEEPPGQTIEVMMRSLKPSKVKPFYSKCSRSAAEATKTSGIGDLFPTCRVSSYLFHPCGYSANGLMKQDEYFTIHITPEPEFSYASFETNAAMENYIPFLRRVLAIFEPGSFICTFIADSKAPGYSAHVELEKAAKMPGYCRSDLHSAHVGYDRKLTFVRFIRAPL